MNLQEALNYRNNCILCNRKMTIENMSWTPNHIELDKNGVRVYANFKKNRFYTLLNYDGTWDNRGKENHQYIDSKIRKSKLINVEKRCNHCRSEIMFKSRSVGPTTMGTSINNLYSISYSYSILIKKYYGGKYDIHLDKETIRHHNDKEFYHLNNDYVNNRSELCHGNYKTDTIQSINTMKFSAINLSNINTSDEFVDKFNLYTLFS